MELPVSRFQVEILTGADKGKQGIVNCVIKERNWCFVEGLNCKYKWIDRSATNPGNLIKEEKPLLVTNEVQLVDPSDNKGTGTDWRFTEEGKRVRVSQRTGRIVPLTKAAEDTAEDMVEMGSYKETAKDTTEKDLQEITFAPKLSTFEQDIMDSMHIKEDRKPAKTYWY